MNTQLFVPCSSIVWDELIKLFSYSGWAVLHAAVACVHGSKHGLQVCMSQANVRGPPHTHIFKTYVPKIHREVCRKLHMFVS